MTWIINALHLCLNHIFIPLFSAESVSAFFKPHISGLFFNYKALNFLLLLLPFYKAFE